MRKYKVGNTTPNNFEIGCFSRQFMITVLRNFWSILFLLNRGNTFFLKRNLFSLFCLQKRAADHYCFSLLLFLSHNTSYLFSSLSPPFSSNGVKCVVRAILISSLSFRFFSHSQPSVYETENYLGRFIATIQF